MDPAAPILVVTRRLPSNALAQFKDRPYPNMIKFVVDIEQGILALGGELHVDAETILLDGGSEQSVLWGGNYFPGRGAETCVEYSSMINLRPAQQNPSMIVLDEGIRTRMRGIVHTLIGKGEPWE